MNNRILRKEYSLVLYACLLMSTACSDDGTNNTLNYRGHDFASGDQLSYYISGNWSYSSGETGEYAYDLQEDNTQVDAIPAFYNYTGNYEAPYLFETTLFDGVPSLYTYYPGDRNNINGPELVVIPNQDNFYVLSEYTFENSNDEPNEIQSGDILAVELIYTIYDSYSADEVGELNIHIDCTVGQLRSITVAAGIFTTLAVSCESYKTETILGLTNVYDTNTRFYVSTEYGMDVLVEDTTVQYFSSSPVTVTDHLNQELAGYYFPNMSQKASFDGTLGSRLSGLWLKRMWQRKALENP